MLLSKTQVSIKAEVRSWNYTGFISYFHTFFLFKQSHSPGLQPNLSILEPLCKQWSWISTTQFCSAFASEKLSSLEKYLWVPEPMCTQTDCVDVYKESGSQTNAFIFFPLKSEFLHLFIFTFPAHIYPKSLDTNSQTSMPNMLMSLWTELLEYSLGKKCLIQIFIQDL